MYDFFLIPNVTFSFEDTRKMPGRGGGGGVLVRRQRDNKASILFYLFYFLFILFFSRLAYSAFFFLLFFFSSTSGACAQTNNLTSAGSYVTGFCGKFLIAKQIMRAIRIGSWRDFYIDLKPAFVGLNGRSKHRDCQPMPDL